MTETDIDELRGLLRNAHRATCAAAAALGRQAAEIERLRAENKTWQNQGLLEQCNRQAGRIEELEKDALDLANDVMAQADIDWQSRDQYPHQQQKYDRDTETARRVIKVLRGTP